jgi:hypothetical protein
MFKVYQIVESIIRFFLGFKITKKLNFLFSKSLFIFYITCSLSLKAFLALYISSLIYISYSIFKIFFNIISLVKTFTVSPASVGNNEIAYTVFLVLSSLGVFKAFWDVFTLIFPIVISFFVFRLARGGIKIYEELQKTIYSSYQFLKI